ncbi:MAG: GGDEF domain-containing protein [Gammaproteobacteria bacterium]|jgi:diguanylate cyclase (GGDEF)-like protein
MHERYDALDRVLKGLSAQRVFALAAAGVALVGLLDYVAGYEISFSLFYFGPVALAAWYADRRSAIATAIMAAGAWLVADTAAGHPYSHQLITLWELSVRLGVFLIIGLVFGALRAALERERALARTDVLTGVATRRAFEEQFEHDLRLAQRTDGIFTLAFLDLDDFKQVNDTYGHTEGDRVLRVTGDILKKSTRVADTVARLGGDEFVLLLPDTNPKGAEEAIFKIRQELRRSLATVAKSTVNFSVGAITFLDAPRTTAEALTAADALMYAAKHRGKNAALFRVVKKRPKPSGTPRRQRKLLNGTQHG